MAIFIKGVTDWFQFSKLSIACSAVKAVECVYWLPHLSTAFNSCQSCRYLDSAVKAVDTFSQFTLLYFQIGIDKSTLIGASENEVKRHARMETERYGYEIYALKRSFGSLKENLEFPMEIRGSK